jgi:glycosyltransferase involved in cell wall biosynthesis
VKLGLIARSDPRGLGHQTRAVHDNLEPDRTLVVAMGELGRGYPTNPSWYPDATTLPFDGHRLPELATRAWLDGLDVVYTAETPYDHRLPTWCAQHDVALVVHVNPEFDHWTTDHTKARPSTFWSATTWRHDLLPAGTRVVPMPTAPHPRARVRDGSSGLLHIVGRRALADRNGTAIVFASWRHQRTRARWTITAQDQLAHARPPRSIDLQVHGPLEDPDGLYDLGDVLVLPRRYGGLCLPALEAMAAGIPVVMPKVSPNPDWPIIPIGARRGKVVRTAAGQIPTVDVAPRELAHLVDYLAGTPAEVASASRAALAWAQEHTWEALRPLWLDELARAVESRVAA